MLVRPLVKETSSISHDLLYVYFLLLRGTVEEVIKLDLMVGMTENIQISRATIY